MKLVVSSVNCILQIQPFTEHNQVHNTEREPAQQEQSKQVRRYLQAFRFVVSNQVRIATVDPQAFPYDGVDTKSNQAQQQVHN